MKNLLIIYPHFPPSNLAGVHRPRLIANFLEEFDWHPIILTVKEEFYEEPLDYDLVKTVKPHVEVIKTDARKVPKPRIYGDIGLRAFNFLKQKALEIIQERDIHFIWIPIPSFYVAVLGRILHEKTRIPYGIDYIDPWVRDISNRRNLRFILSNLVARVLEPYAIKKASLISGVSENYFLPALKRTFKRRVPRTVAMPYGFDPDDHKIKLDNLQFPWDGKNCKPIVYAGAFLPNSVYFTEILFEIIAELKNSLFKDFCLFFLGTGKYLHKSVSVIAKEKKVDDVVFEIKERFPYLHILNFLSEAYGIAVIGSTEKHYTASKIFQSLLSERPVFSIFHHQSLTVKILEDTNAMNFTAIYHETDTRQALKQKIKEKFIAFLTNKPTWKPNLGNLNKYSALESARKLAEKLNEVVYDL